MTAGCNKSMPLPNPFQWGTQLHRMFEALNREPGVFNYEFRSFGVLNYTGRISEARKRLEPLGWTIYAERVKGGVWGYRLGKIPEKKEPPPSPGFWAKVGGWFGVGGH